jgi:hypothetical protein
LLLELNEVEEVVSRGFDLNFLSLSWDYEVILSWWRRVFQKGRLFLFIMYELASLSIGTESIHKVLLALLGLVES